MGAEMNKKRLATAYHEAGHAVMAVRLRLRLDATRIAETDDAYGTTIITHSIGTDDPDQKLTPSVRERIEKEALFHFAGRHAERKFHPKGYRRAHAASDTKSAVNILSYVEHSSNLLPLYTKWIDGRAKEIITGPAVWPCVKRLAEALYDVSEMKGAEVRAFLRGQKQHICNTRFAKPHKP